MISPISVKKKQISNNPLLNSKKRDHCGSPVVIPSIKAQFLSAWVGRRFKPAPRPTRAEASGVVAGGAASHLNPQLQ
jgi:hypothetical protein